MVSEPCLKLQWLSGTHPRCHGPMLEMESPDLSIITARRDQQALVFQTMSPPCTVVAEAGAMSRHEASLTRTWQ